MERAVERLLAFIALLCNYRYRFQPDADYFVMSAWATRVRAKLDQMALPGPEEVRGDLPQSAEDYAWFIDYDSRLSVAAQGVAPDAQTQEMWAFIDIKTPWTQKVGIKAMDVFTYGTACRCCHGFRLILWTGLVFAFGFFLG